MENKKLYDESIILIGPSGTGKTAVSRELEEITHMPRLSLDNIAYMHRQNGHDREFDNVEDFNYHMIKNEIKRAENSETPTIFDFGAGHSVYKDKKILKRVKRQLIKFRNVVLLLPTKDINESLDILEQRSTADTTENKAFMEDTSNINLATLVIYENGKKPNEIANKIIEIVTKRNIENDLLENELDEEAKNILLLIKEDYYDKMSPDKKQVINSMIEKGDNVVVNFGIGPYLDNAIAHSGRGLKDDKIHLYPDTKRFKDKDDKTTTLKGILPHELFHFFIQPDKNLGLEGKEADMAHYYEEGLVEKEARKFCEKHKEIEFYKAWYDYNIQFVDAIQEEMGAASPEIIFSEVPYLKKIAKYKDIYIRIKEEENKAIQERKKERKKREKTKQKEERDEEER